MLPALVPVPGSAPGHRRGRLGALILVLVTGSCAVVPAPAEARATAKPMPGEVRADPHSGRVAILRGGAVTVCNTVAATPCTAPFAAGLPEPRLQAIRGHAVMVNGSGCEAGCPVMVLDDSGRELFRWTTEEHVFPGTGTRLLEDGSGVFREVFLTEDSRKELGLDAAFDDVQSLVVTRRFADGRTRIFALHGVTGRRPGAAPETIVHDAIGLTPDDVVMLTADGSMSLRHGDRPAFRTALGGEPGRWRLADVDPAGRLVLGVNGFSGAVAGVDLGTGAVRWSWDGIARQAQVRRLFAASADRELAALPSRLPEIGDLVPAAGADAVRTGALGIVYGAADARILSSGDVLLIGKTAQEGTLPLWGAVLDPAAGVLRGGELYDRLERSGLKSARELMSVDRYGWRPDRGILVVPGPGLLVEVQGRWYRVELE